VTSARRLSNRIALVVVPTVVLALATALSANVAVSAAPAAGPGPRVVDSCDQTPAAGHFACYAERLVSAGFTSRRELSARAAAPSGYSPSDLASAYVLPSATAGAGRRVYIIDAFDDPSAEPDLQAYRKQYGLPTCTTSNKCFQKLNQRGATSPLPRRNANWAGETSLDLDMVSAACPNCDITLIESDDDGNNLLAAAREATTLGAKFVSMSWGAAENGDEPEYDARYFAATGVVYAAATGDVGFRDGAGYPATSPRAVAVGGTKLQQSSNARGWTESVWNDSLGAPDSGCSATEAKPAWQSVIPKSTCGRRAEADVSAVADPMTGVAVYQTYGGDGWSVYGGTSAAAPIVASIYALAGTPAANARPGSFAYARTSDINDVTSGNNGRCQATRLCTAGSGWDGPTGLGTPEGVGAFSASGSTDNTVTVANPGSVSGAVGHAGTLQVEASDSAGAKLTYSARNLPAGLSINASTGVVSGTINVPGDNQVQVVASDAAGASGSAVFRWGVSAATGSCRGNAITNGSFEGGVPGWTTSDTIVHSNATNAHAGTRFARLDGYGRTHTDRLSRAITIPAGCHATLRYYLWVHSADRSRTVHDTLTVAAAGTTVRRYTNRNRGGRYYRRTVNLSRYAGDRLSLVFTGRENNSLATSFYLDDVGLYLS
jgi:hypothetical protein